MQSQGWADLYPWAVKRSTATPLFRQIYAQIRSAALTGALAPGTKLPSSRALATSLGVARASVVAAYEQLLTEGYVEARAGSGTFVAANLVRLTSASRRGGSRKAKRPSIRTEPFSLAVPKRATLRAALPSS